MVYIINVVEILFEIFVRVTDYKNGDDMKLWSCTS
jgi:hypothetical protein